MICILRQIIGVCNARLDRDVHRIGVIFAGLAQNDIVFTIIVGKCAAADGDAGEGSRIFEVAVAIIAGATRLNVQGSAVIVAVAGEYAVIKCNVLEIAVLQVDVHTTHPLLEIDLHLGLIGTIVQELAIGKGGIGEALKISALDIAVLDGQVIGLDRGLPLLAGIANVEAVGEAFDGNIIQSEKVNVNGLIIVANAHEGTGGTFASSSPIGQYAGEGEIPHGKLVEVALDVEAHAVVSRELVAVAVDGHVLGDLQGGSRLNIIEEDNGITRLGIGNGSRKLIRGGHGNAAHGFRLGHVGISIVGIHRDGTGNLLGNVRNAITPVVSRRDNFGNIARHVLHSISCIRRIYAGKIMFRNRYHAGIAGIDTNDTAILFSQREAGKIIFRNGDIYSQILGNIFSATPRSFPLINGDDAHTVTAVRAGENIVGDGTGKQLELDRRRTRRTCIKFTVGNGYISDTRVVTADEIPGASFKRNAVDDDIHIILSEQHHA